MSAAYVVEVNEGVIEASRQGIEWWRTFRHIFGEEGRIVETKAACVVGGVVEVACDDQPHAEWLAAQMVERHGLPRTAVRVKRPASPPVAAPGETGGDPDAR